MTVFESPAAFLAVYSRIARENRPDWDEFVKEAKHDPMTIYYEVCDVATDMIGPAFDVLLDHAPNYRGAMLTAVADWVDNL